MLFHSRTEPLAWCPSGKNFTLAPSLFQVSGRPSQVVHFRFQFADDDLESIQLDPLESLHALLKPVLEALKDLHWRQLWSGSHGEECSTFAFCSLSATMALRGSTMSVACGRPGEYRQHMPASTKTAAHDDASVILGAVLLITLLAAIPMLTGCDIPTNQPGSRGTLIENALVCQTEESLIIVHAFDHANNTRERGQDMQAAFMSGCEGTDRPEPFTIDQNTGGGNLHVVLSNGGKGWTTAAQIQ
jgi:hypothetical protein